jgi:hypothetical protein
VLRVHDVAGHTQGLKVWKKLDQIGSWILTKATKPQIL